MNPVTKVMQLKNFMDAVERGEKLHPGPFTIQEFRLALNSEIFEMKNEDCYVTMCVKCKPEKCAGYAEKIRRYRAEIMDVAVVAYRFVAKIDEVIAGNSRHGARDPAYDP